MTYKICIAPELILGMLSPGTKIVQKKDNAIVTSEIIEGIKGAELVGLSVDVNSNGQVILEVEGEPTGGVEVVDNDEEWMVVLKMESRWEML